MEARKTILVIEDEPNILLGLKDALSFEGYRVVTASCGKDGLTQARAERPHVVLLDLMLPDMNGYQICEELRRQDAFMPIIMLTARSQEADKIRGLDAGADDYVTKPFSVGELVARIRALFRRTGRPVENSTFKIGDVTVNVAAHTVQRGTKQETEQLSFYEVELLRLLHERSGQPVSREEILNKIWGVDANPTNRTIDNFIVKLRKKLEKRPDKPEHILTVYGYGYKLVP
ncbi:MAG: response regulator transcription factor [Polyangiaceae bacterium]|nr:response regulator transcription factor [Polyangiaceae bacterium]MCL4752085.1 response regulator transcription factor [Myxococcales bacterium]